MAHPIHRGLREEALPAHQCAVYRNPLLTSTQQPSIEATPYIDLVSYGNATLAFVSLDTYLNSNVCKASGYLVMLNQCEKCISRTASENLVRVLLCTASISHSLWLMNEWSPEVLKQGDRHK